MSTIILFADDSKTMQTVAAITFHASDYQYVGAASADEAVTKARGNKPRLILADVEMPGKDGYELCREIKHDPELSDVPVIMICGNSSAYDSKRGEEVGADGHFTKPWDTQVMLDKVEEILRKSAGRTAKPKTVATAAPTPAPNVVPKPPILPGPEVAGNERVPAGGRGPAPRADGRRSPHPIDRSKGQTLVGVSPDSDTKVTADFSVPGGDTSLDFGLDNAKPLGSPLGTSGDGAGTAPGRRATAPQAAAGAPAQIPGRPAGRPAGHPPGRSPGRPPGRQEDATLRPAGVPPVAQARGGQPQTGARGGQPGLVPPGGQIGSDPAISRPAIRSPGPDILTKQAPPPSAGQPPAAGAAAKTTPSIQVPTPGAAAEQPESVRANAVPASSPSRRRPPMISGRPRRRAPAAGPGHAAAPAGNAASAQVARRIEAAIPQAATAAAQQAGLDPNGPEMRALMALSKDVVERIVWEVVPDLAETIIRENLDQLVAKR